jgi:uncharacterized repeat protein (TIGR01451 family)
VLEGLEGRVVLSVVIPSSNNNGNGYAALSFNSSGGYVPPDSCGAAGPSAYVETVNQTVALYGSKASGSPSTTASLSTFWFTTGGLPHADGGSGLSDPIVVYNDQIGRFIVGDQDVDFNTHVSNFDIAVSKSNTPGSLGTSDWNFYQIKTTETGYDADYPGNFGFNNDAFVFALNMFGTSTDHVQVVSVSNADLQNGVAPSSLHVYHNDVNDFSLRPTTMHDAVAGGPMWLVTEHGDGQSIDVIKMTNVLSSSATFTYTNLAVTPYSAVNYPLNPNGSVITNNIDSRIMKAAEWNNTIVASQSVGVSSTEDDAQWYAINVGSGTPALAQQGRVSGGNHTYITYPAIDINASGQIGMTYMKSGNDSSNDYMSMYVTGRNSGDTAGTMETPVLVPAGAGQANYKDFTTGGRAGDLSGINVDPVDGSFWGASEFANTQATANWGTAVANFQITSPLPSTDMALTLSGPSSVTAGSNATYTITITNNGPATAQGVVMTDTLPSGATVVSMSQASGSDSFTFAQSGGTETATATGNLASGATDSFTLVVTVPSSAPNGSSFTDSAAVQATNPDPTPSNNSASTTATVVNNNPTAALSVQASGPSTANEGDTVTYTITVTNTGTATATGVTLTDTLASLLNYRSSTTSQGTISVSGGVVTFTIGSIAVNGTVTATVTAQATEDGTASDSATASATNASNASASATTAFAEPAINVSGAIVVSGTSFSGQVATFTHASGVEPVGNFVATIHWGDGSTSTGTITQSGSTYTVTGSHNYRRRGNHTISTTVAEKGNSVDKYGGDDGSPPVGGGFGGSVATVRGPAGGSGPGVVNTAVVSATSPLTPAVLAPANSSSSASVGAGNRIAAATPSSGAETGIAPLAPSVIPQDGSEGTSSSAGLARSWAKAGAWRRFGGF